MQSVQPSFFLFCLVFAGVVLVANLFVLARQRYVDTRKAAPLNLLVVNLKEEVVVADGVIFSTKKPVGYQHQLGTHLVKVLWADGSFTFFEPKNTIFVLS